MSRKVVNLSVAMVALSALAVVSTIARPGTSNPVEQVTMTTPDFDRVFSDAASVTLPAFTDADREALRQIGLRRIDGSRSDR